MDSRQIDEIDQPNSSISLNFPGLLAVGWLVGLEIYWSGSQPLNRSAAAA